MMKITVCLLLYACGFLWMHDRDEARHARDATADRAGVAHQLELQHAELLELRTSVDALGVACEARR